MGILSSKALDQLRKENEELKNKFHEMYEKEKDHKSIEDTINKLKVEVTRLLKKRKIIVEDLTTKQAEDEQKKQSIAELDKRIADLTEMKDDLQNTILSFTDRLQVLESGLKDGNVNVTDLMNQQIPVELTSKIEELEKKEKELNKKLTLKEEELFSIEKLINEKLDKASGSETSHSLIEEEFRLNSELDSKRKEIEELSNKQRKLQLEISSGAKKISILEDEETRLNLKLKEYDSIFAEKNKQVNEIEATIETNKNIVETFQNEILNIESQNQVRIDRLAEEEKIKNIILEDLNKTISAKEEVKRTIDSEVEKLKKAVSIHKHEENESVWRIDKLVEVEKSKNELITELQLKIQTLENEKNSFEANNAEFFKKINHLRDEEKVLESKLARLFEEDKDRSKMLEEISKSIVVKETELSIIEEKLAEVDGEFNKKFTLLAEEEKSKINFAKELDDLIARKEKNKKAVEEKLLNLNDELKTKMSGLTLEINEKSEILKNLDNEIALKENEKLSLQKSFETQKEKLLSLIAEADELKLRNEEMSEEEKTKIDFVRHLNENISALEEAKASLVPKIPILEKEINERQKRINVLTQESDEIQKNITAKTTEFERLNSAVSSQAGDIEKYEKMILELENKSIAIKDEIEFYETLKSELPQKINAEKETFEKLKEQNSKLSEFVALLEERRAEIEKGNTALENRFTKMFQKFNNELNEINKKRSMLEQIVLKKEKDIDEKDQQLFEKIAALEESERVLSMRQAEIESYEQLVRDTKEQKEMVKLEMQKLQDKTAEMLNVNDDIKLETDMLLKKKAGLERELQELLNMMSDKYSRSKDDKFRLDNELKEYDEQLQRYRERITDSMKELGDIQKEVSAARVESEELRGNISKLSANKTKLHEEISKHQAVLQKYQQIREKLKMQQSSSETKNEEQTVKGNKSFQ